MSRTPFFLTAFLLSCAALLSLTGPASAQVYRGGSYRGPIYRPWASVVPPNHMPGWDWWRIYPWSPYNYGRNPYNPAWIPVPYYAGYYPYYVPYGSYVPGTGTDVTSQGNMFPSYLGQQVLMPQPTGGYTVPPADAAQIIVRVPDASAQVFFDDHRTYTQGSTTRYFVTPSLPSGGSYNYTVTATWTQGGQSVTRQRQIQVAPGHTTVVDFTRPD